MKYTQIHKIFIKYFRAELSIPISKNVIVATSGGQDSLALWKLLKDYQQYYDYNIHITYCNHKWRKDSIENANVLNYMSQYWGIYFHYYSTCKSLRNEAEGRIWRYQKLIKLSIQTQPSELLLAHTLTDKIETFLKNFFLRYFINEFNSLLPIIYFLRNSLLLRPLITISRYKTFWLCQLSYLPIWSDYTNYFLKSKRNRIRFEFLPYIKTNFNSEIEIQFRNFLNLQKLQSLYINSLVNNFLRKTLKYNRYKTILKVTLIQNLPLILQYIILKQFIFYCFKISISVSLVKNILCRIYLDKLPYTIYYKKHSLEINKNYIYYRN
nr:tRNA(Ile)-lysidine synthetase [Cavernulicola chilensis]